MSWCLEKSGDQIFLLINGKRAVSATSFEILPHITHATHGSNSKSIWFSFDGCKVGKRMDRAQFKATNLFSNEFESCSQNSTFLAILYKQGILRKRKPSKKSNLSSNEARHVEMPEQGNTLDTDVTTDPDTSLTEKLLGQYEVTIDRLKEPNEKYLCRQVKDGWVEIIKQKIKAHPAPVTTILPVMVDPKEVATIENFDVQKVSTYTYMTLGGNHLRAALTNAVEEDEKIKEIIGKINVLVYASLTEEEARHIGNVHNIKCKTLDFTFQDKVYQARKLEDRSVTKIACMLSDMEMKDVHTTSASTIANIANMSVECFAEVVKIFETYEQVNGPEKSFPVQFFRSLQGITENSQILFLRKVSSDIKSLFNVTTEINNLKQKRKLEDIFVKLTNCTSWDEAKMLYPVHAENLNDFLDSNMSAKYIPQRLVDFCKDALSTDSMPEVTVEITIKKNGIIVENNNLIKILKRKVEKEIKKSKRLRSLLVDEARDSELQPYEE